MMTLGLSQRWGQRCCGDGCLRAEEGRKRRPDEIREGTGDRLPEQISGPNFPSIHGGLMSET